MKLIEIYNNSCDLDKSLRELTERRIQEIWQRQAGKELDESNLYYTVSKVYRIIYTCKQKSMTDNQIEVVVTNALELTALGITKLLD